MNFIRISYISVLFILISCDSFKTVNLYESVIDQPDPYESFSYKDIFIDSYKSKVCIYQLKFRRIQFIIN